MEETILSFEVKIIHEKTCFFRVEDNILTQDFSKLTSEQKNVVSDFMAAVHRASVDLFHAGIKAKYKAEND